MSELLEKTLSPKLYGVLKKRIQERINYNTNPITGVVEPFLFVLEGTGVIDRQVDPPKAIFRDAYLDGRTIIYDPFDEKKNSKIIRNVTSVDIRYDEDKQKEVSVEIVEPVIFKNGYCKVSIEEEHKLAYLMFGDGNISKPSKLTRGNALPLIKWTEDKSTLYSTKASTEVLDIKLLGKALEIAGKADLTRMKDVLFNVSRNEKFASYNPENKTSDAITNDFFVFVRNQPRMFLETNVDDRSKAELAVTETTLKGILVHDKENAKYMLDAYGKQSVFFAYNKVTASNPEKELMEFLLDAKNGEKLAKLQKANKPRLHPYLPEEDTKVLAKGEKEEV